jgi:hypothetical protein
MLPGEGRRGKRHITDEICAGGNGHTFQLSRPPIISTVEIYGGPAKLALGASVGGFVLSDHGQTVTTSEEYNEGEIRASFNW